MRGSDAQRQVAVSLLSGGIDSLVASTLAKKRGDELYLLSVNYGQVMQRELSGAVDLVEFLKPKQFKRVIIDGFADVSWSARTDPSLVEFGRVRGLNQGNVPAAYPPGRDFTFIAMAAAWAESIILREPDVFRGAKIIIGTNFTDSLDYPDCQPYVYELFTALLRASLKATKVLGKDFEVEAPLLTYSKQDVVRLGEELKVPFSCTWSCYTGGERACGRCDACRIRYYAFKNNGLEDPIEYEPIPITPLHFERERRTGGSLGTLSQAKSMQGPSIGKETTMDG